MLDWGWLNTSGLPKGHSSFCCLAWLFMAFSCVVYQNPGNLYQLRPIDQRFTAWRFFFSWGKRTQNTSIWWATRNRNGWNGRAMHPRSWACGPMIDRIFTLFLTTIKYILEVIIELLYKPNLRFCFKHFRFTTGIYGNQPLRQRSSNLVACGNSRSGSG